MRKLFPSLLFVLATLASPAQSLQEVINLALENNYDLRIVRTESDIATNNNTLGNAGFWPVIDAGGQYTISSTNATQEFFNGESNSGNNARSTNLNGDVALNWRLFDGFGMFASRDRLTSLETMGNANVKFFIDQTVSDLALVYYQIIKEYRVLGILRSSIEVSRFRYTLENARKNVGAGTALDYNQALVDYRADSSLIIEQEAVIRQLEIQLNEIINRDLYDSLVHDNQIPLVDVLPEAERLMEVANLNNKNLEVFRLNELVAESDERIARSFKYPQIDLFGSYSYNRSTNEVGFLRSNRNYGPQVGMRVRLNLFNGGNFNREIRNTQYARNIAQLDREALELNINSLILQQVARYRAYVKRLEISEANVISAGRALDVARAQLNEGTITGVDFRITQVTLISAENNREEILYSLKAAEIDLLRLMGQVTEYFL